jgi:glycosyltransferase involved in cell wall biosynthesis
MIATKPTLLVLTPRFPYPVIGGDRLRIYHLCKHLAQAFQLTLLSLCESQAEMRMTVPNDGIFTAIERVFHPRWRQMFGCLRVLPTNTPLQVGFYRNVEFAMRVHSLMASHDGVLAHLIRTGDYIQSIDKPKVVEMTDSLAMSYSRIRRTDSRGFLRKLLYRLEEARLTAYEKYSIDHCDLSIFVSEIDRDHAVSSTGKPRTLICPNGVDVDALPFQFDPDGATIAFIGNNTAFPNKDAVWHFALDILPTIRARIVNARFLVIGRIEASERARLEQVPGVVVSGEVASIPTAAQRASVGVCPVRFGAGIQNKLLEYMALGIPAVTSPIGLEGLNAVMGRDLLVAHSQSEWTDLICDLIEDRARAHAIAVAGRQYVERHHSWASLVAPLRNAIAVHLSCNSR